MAKKAKGPRLSGASRRIGLQMEMLWDSKKAHKFLKDLLINTSKIESHHRSYWQILQTIAFQDTMDHFDKQQGPGHKKWVDWSFLYLENIRKYHPEKLQNKILQDSGRMRDSVRFATGADVAAGVLLVNPAKTKTGFPYAWWHNTKKASAEGNKGPRKYFWISKSAVKQMAIATIQYVNRPLLGSRK